MTTTTIEAEAPSTTETQKTTIPSSVLQRVLDEGYGPGAWHGADFKAALEDVSPEIAFWRPSEGRHNIAEVALHHAYCARSVRGQLSGAPPELFVLEGEDWFDLPDEGKLAWAEILKAVAAEQHCLSEAVAGLGAAGAERFDLVLGVTCHAVYHAGQIQLIKRLHGG
jgi:hypothetical protein